MSTKSREVIYGSQIRGAKIRAEGARAAEAIREADRAEAEAWSIQMEGYGGPAQPSPTIAQCLNGGYGWLEVECHRCKARASLIPPPRIALSEWIKSNISLPPTRLPIIVPARARRHRPPVVKPNAPVFGLK
jgi:hypothetical protein